MATPDETAALLREIRDLIASQAGRYDGYLEQSRANWDKANAESLAQQKRLYEENAVRVKKAAWIRLIVGCIWFAIVVAAAVYYLH
jgi:hypothetical protein